MNEINAITNLNKSHLNLLGSSYKQTKLPPSRKLLDRVYE